MLLTIDRNTFQQFWRVTSFFCLLLFLQTISPTLDVLSKEEGEREPRTMTALKIQFPPKIDGRLDDDCWKLAEPTTEFIQLFPDDGTPATEQTIIKVLYDNENLYFGIECLDSQPKNIDARLVPRDSDPYPGDLIGIVLDTFHDHQNAYCFWTNPRGIQMDFRSYNDFAQGWGGRDFSWDGVWRSAAQIKDTGWTVEVAIPFSTLRFPRKKEQIWGVNVQRYQKSKGEHSHWAPITRDDGGVLKVSKAGHLVGLEDLEQGLHLELLPYGTSSYNENLQGSAQKQDAGLDVKYGITSNLTTDLTINPDFGHIEGDEEQINLTRFELFLKEKRPFFMEGRNLFSPMNLFYTRRIRNPRFGANLTGKVGDYSIGLLTAQDEEEKANPVKRGSATALSTYGVFRLQRDIFKKSSIGIIGVGKEGTEGEYNRAFGMDMSLRPRQSELNLKFGKSFHEGIEGDDWFTSINAGYNTDRFQLGGGFEQTQPEFNVDKIGYRPHDAHVGEKEFRGHVGYGHLLRRFGIHNIWTRQEFRATKRTDDSEWGWSWDNAGIRIIFFGHHWIDLLHENWYFRWKQRGYRGDTFSLWYVLAGKPLFDDTSIRVSTGEQYDWEDDYFGSIKAFSITQRLKILDNLTLNYDAQIVWEYFPTGEFDEVKRVANVRLTYLPTRDIFIRVFAPINLTTRQYGVNALISYAYRPMSRFYLAYNERRSKDASFLSLVDRIIMAKISCLWNL